MLESGAAKLRRCAIACCVAVALAFCSALAMGAIADAPTSNQAFAASKIKTAKIVDAGNKNKTVTKKTVNMALTGRNSTTLKVVTTPAKGAVKSIKWYSTSKKVASVSSKGHVVAKKKGTATIKAKVKARKGKSRTLYVKVKVSKGGWQKSGKVTKASSCTKKGTQVVRSLDGWKSKTITAPLAAHKYGSDWKCVVCGKQGGGLAIAKTAVNLATGAQESKIGSVNYVDGNKDDPKKSNSPWAKAYNDAKDKVAKSAKRYPDCGYSVVIAIRYSGVDAGFCSGKITPAGKTKKKTANMSVNGIKEYLESKEGETKGWKKVGTYKAGKFSGCSPQPGDVLVYNPKSSSDSGNHARIYVGYDAVKARFTDLASDEAKTGLWFSDSSQGKSRYPFLTYSKKSDETSKGTRNFAVYRFG